MEKNDFRLTYFDKMDFLRDLQKKKCSSDFQTVLYRDIALKYFQFKDE